MCRQCQEGCQISGSKPAGANPSVRIELVCLANKRNMERRVAKRPANDPLKQFWNSVAGDPDKLANWSRAQKKRKRGANGTDAS